MKISELNNASEATKRLNPELFRSAVGAVATARSERNSVQTLDGTVKARRQRKGQVAIRVSFVVFRRRLLDDDSNVYSIKPLRDAVSNTLGLDDADARIAFEYSQHETKGEQGVIVRIEALNPALKPHVLVPVKAT